MKKLNAAAIAAFSLTLAACQGSDPEAASSASTEVEPTPAPEVVEVVETVASALPPIPGDGIDVDRYAEHLRILASDEFEGRAPGTRGERLTLDYLVGQFLELGLAPGNGDSYLQPVPMVELTNVERSDLTVQQGDESFTLNYPEQMIIGSRRLGTDPHGVSDSGLVFVGYGVVAPEYGWNDYEGLDVEGKTVVILVNDPGFETGNEDLFNGRAMTYYGRWTYKYEEAARQGASAALIVHETEPASYPWEVVINSWSGAQFELGEPSGEPIMPLEGWITVDTARELFERAGLDFEAEKARAQTAEFDPVSLGMSVSGSVRNSIRRGESYNVVASIPGTERPDEAIVYVAHWDHLGRNMALPGTTGIYNGAVDNASGTAAMLELARLYQEAGAPKRTVTFLVVTLEEYGLLGSRYYVNNPVIPTDHTVAAINMDAMSLIGPTNDVVVVGYGSSELEDILLPAVEAQGRVMVQEPTPEAGFYYRSDHFNFARVGVPALYAKGGVDHRELGTEYGMAQQREYRDVAYHKPADVFNPDWDLRGVAEDLELLYMVGRELADGEQWPNWREGNEFRAIRDADRP
ncbi:M28 family metallopeptidase [Wenzhouxiangella marina]|uniref:Peptidase M28 n=1 Tax=Wenzhouxiangella marina TaxID=1579979 RepID=A0A0K0XTV7_9GAMM|nr:M28 family metallopeptidase [Wenzhouxiangella marina]AKS41057.1 Peptidase M28 [Wenzhouxiangella marina]MBB6087935.1 Zn-dependent M28 family amino/carboxypeptidase [Wenzhouxiangella marina]